MGRKELKDSNKILLALDGSKISKNTTVLTIQIAKMLHYEILGLYVIDEELVTIDYVNYRKELGVDYPSLSRADRADLFEKKGQEVLEWLKSNCMKSGVHVTTEIGIGGVPDIILSQAQETTLLALGRRGNGQPDNLNYLGRNFRHIAHRSNSPFFVGGDKVPEIKKLLLAYNGKERSQRALLWAKKFQDCMSCELKILIVQQHNDHLSDKDWLEDIQSHLHESQINDSQIMKRRGDPADQIVKVAKETESNLILMGGHRHKAPLEWLEGSTLNEVLRKTSLPVLVG